MGYIAIIVVFAIIGAVVSGRLKSKFKKYSKLPIASGLSGKEVAEAMLKHYGIHDVRVVPGKGALTDHYNPRNKTISLSEPVYSGRNVAAASVAAHECGHAVQDDTNYAWLNFRSSMVPIVNFAATAQQWLFMAMIFGFATSGMGNMWLIILIVTFGITTLFSFVTLPVEFDASRRALVWLDQSGVANSDSEYYGAKDALKWAAMTYVVAALGSLVTLLYFVLRFAGSSD